MTPYTGLDRFDDVQIYDTNTPVIGGGDGDSNKPIEQLTNRTQYLFNRLGKYFDVRVLGNGGTVDALQKYILQDIHVGGNASITVDPVGNFKVGDIVPFKCTCPLNKCVTINLNGSVAMDGSISMPTIWMCDGEEFKLVCAGDHWIFHEPRGNWDKVGQDALVRIQPRNSFIAQGTESSRADFARVWNAVKDIAIPDFSWQSDPYSMKGFFSSGNGATTFRWPDMRGMFMRGLDLGRGVRLGNTDNRTGSYEPDDNKSHTHNASEAGDQKTDEDATTYRVIRSFTDVKNLNSGFDFKLMPSGGLEAKPKNIGFIPAIYF